MPSQHAEETCAGNRFAFGENWSRFLEVLDDERIRQAEQSLCAMLEVTSLEGKRFLDVGAGSGLFSLAARNLGAQVHSFDYDPQSVACTAELRRRYASGDSHWTVEEGSVLDREYLAGLGRFDVVYAWGVLHHTGNMYAAFANVVDCLAPEGRLFLAVYNDQGWISRYWGLVKRAYNRSRVAATLLATVHVPYLFGARWLVRKLSGRGPAPRGMSLWHDTWDWLGGYPFEVARPEAVVEFFRDRGLVLEKLTTCGRRMGCNEFLFCRRDAP